MQPAMAARAVAVVVAALLFAAPAADAGLVTEANAIKDDSVSAIQKVIHMLNDVLAKAKKDKQDEEVSFAAYNTWCSNHQASVSEQVRKGKESVETLSAEIAKLGTDAEALGDEVAALQADMTRFEGEIKTRKSQREEDHQGFLSEQQDYAESVDAIGRAIMVLQKQNFDRSALLQLKESQQLPATAQQMVAAFLGMMDDDSSDQPDFASRSAPQADAYEFQSGSIIEMLKKLKDEFQAKKTQCEKEEMNAQHAHDMIVQDLTDSSEKAKKDSANKASEKLQKQQRSAVLKRELDSTSGVLAEDEKTLSNTQVECQEKTASYTEKQDLRAEEIQAIEKAVEILTSPDLQGGAKHLSLLQTQSSVLLQVGLRGAAVSDSNGIRQRLRDFLAAESQRLHSQSLGLLVEKLTMSAGDPFSKVKQMISSMITRLLEEANQEAQHKGFCDKELGVNKLTREELTESIDRLTAEVEGGKATITMLGEDISSLSAAVSEIDAAVKQATELRAAEKAKNEATVRDAESAEAAVQTASRVLQDFYKKAAQATALVQLQQVPKAAWGKSTGVKMGTPEWQALANPNFKGTVDLGHQAGQQTFGATYSGRQAETGGILAMLEVIASDFARLKADTMSAEMLSQKAYQDFMNESRKDKAVKLRKVELNTEDKAAAERKLLEDTQDLKFTEDKLAAADRYYEKLVPQCLDQGVSYEARVKAREDEIQSLKEALRILAGEDIA